MSDLNSSNTIIVIETTKSTSNGKTRVEHTVRVTGVEDKRRITPTQTHCTWPRGEERRTAIYIYRFASGVILTEPAVVIYGTPAYWTGEENAPNVAKKRPPKTERNAMRRQQEVHRKTCRRAAMPKSGRRTASLSPTSLRKLWSERGRDDDDDDRTCRSPVVDDEELYPNIIHHPSKFRG